MAFGIITKVLSASQKWSILKTDSMCEMYLCPLGLWYTLPQTAPGFDVASCHWGICEEEKQNKKKQ